MILVAGSANVDFVVRAPRIPAPGETVLGKEFAVFPGGKGANQAVACARAGAPTRLLAALGQDSFAALLESSFQSCGVACHIIRAPNIATGTAFICVSDQGENAITVAPGANSHLLPEHLPNLQGVQYLLLQLETPLGTVTAYAQRAQAQGVRVALNAAPAQSLPPALLQHVDVLFVNESELAAITQTQGSIAQKLAALGVPTAVVTLGYRGCCALHLGQWYVQPAYPVQVVDTTAAGDTFCGAVVTALSQERSLSDALQFGCAAGALACTRAGAQASIPVAAEIGALMSKAPTDTAASKNMLRAYCGIVS